MIKYYFPVLMCLVLLFCFSAASGQTTIDAEFRPRMEFREGFRKPLADSLVPGFLTLQRTRLNADYKGKDLNARISLQDARIWGNSDNKTNSSKVEIYEVWFEYFFTPVFVIKMGRQPLRYDDQRLLAAPNWSNTGLAHDVMVVKYSGSNIQAHFGFAYNNSKDTLFNVSYSYLPKQNYKLMNYIWLSRPVLKSLNLSLIGIYEGFEKKDDYKVVYPRLTFGGNLTYSSDSSSWGAAFTTYFQTGKNPGKAAGSGYADLDAYFLASKFSFKVTSFLNAIAGFDYYSGSPADIDPKKSKTFNRLYGSTHNFNGSMEYYVTLPIQGLIDYYAGIGVKAFPKLSIDLTGHSFYFDKDFIYNKLKTGKYLGSEADILLNYTASKEVEIQGGYSMYLNSDVTNKYFKVDGTSIYPKNWIYLMFTIKPQLFKTATSSESK